MRPDEGDRRAVLVALDLRDRPDPAHGAVARPHDAIFRGVSGRRAVESREEVGDDPFAILWMNPPHPRLVGFDGGLRRQSVDAQVFRRAQARETAAQVDAHAADAADFLNPGQFEFALAEPFEHRLALGRVPEGDANPVAEREGPHLVPAAGDAGRKGFEHLFFTLGHHLAVAALELAAQDGRRDLPKEFADHLFAREAEDVLGGAIEGREPPIRVEGEESFREAVEKLVHHRTGFGRDAGQHREELGGRFAGRGFCAHVAKPR